MINPLPKVLWLSGHSEPRDIATLSSRLAMLEVKGQHNQRTVDYIKVAGRCEAVANLLLTSEGHATFKGLLGRNSWLVGDPSVPEKAWSPKFMNVNERMGLGAAHGEVVGWGRHSFRWDGGAMEVSFSRVLQQVARVVNLAHSKGHGFLGYSGAMNNIAMGFIGPASREALHGLIGTPELQTDLCHKCDGHYRCQRYCYPNAIEIKNDMPALIPDKCTECMHCVAICPTDAWVIRHERQEAFTQAYVKVLRHVLEQVGMDRWLHVNCLVDIRKVCDCMSDKERPIMADLGVLFSRDIVAVEQAALDLMRSGKRHQWVTDQFGEPPDQHILKTIHHRDPYWLVRAAEREGLGSTRYELVDLRGNSSHISG